MTAPKKRPSVRRCKVCLVPFKVGETVHPKCDPALAAPGKRARTSAAAVHEKVEKAEKDSWIGIYRGTETKTGKQKGVS